MKMILILMALAFVAHGQSPYHQIDSVIKEIRILRDSSEEYSILSDACKEQASLAEDKKIRQELKEEANEYLKKSKEKRRLAHESVIYIKRLMKPNDE